MRRTRFDALVIGSGPAGSVAALVLARGGARVALVDKASFPRDKACGDMVGPRGVQLLADLGLPVPDGPRVGDMLVVGPDGAPGHDAQRRRPDLSGPRDGGHPDRLRRHVARRRHRGGGDRSVRARRGAVGDRGADGRLPAGVGGGASVPTSSSAPTEPPAAWRRRPGWSRRARSCGASPSAPTCRRTSTSPPS